MRMNIERIFEPMKTLQFTTIRFMNKYYVNTSSVDKF